MKISLSGASFISLIICHLQGALSKYVKIQKDIDNDVTSRLRQGEIDQVILGQWIDLLQMSLPVTMAPTSLSPTVSPSPTTSTAASSLSSKAPPTTSVTSSPTYYTFAPTAVSPPPTLTFQPTVAASIIPQQQFCSLKLDFQCYRLVNGTRSFCSDIAAVRSNNECVQNVEFEYIVTNDCVEPGCTDAFITNLEVQRDGNVTNLTSLVTNPLIPPGSNVTTAEALNINFCQTRQFNVSSSVLAKTTNTTSQAFCAADNTSKVKIQNANAVKSNAYVVDGLLSARSRIVMRLLLVALPAIMVF